MNDRLTKSRWENAVMILVALFWAFIVIFPLWWVINILFSAPGSASSIHPSLIPNSFSSGFATLKKVLTEGEFLRGYLVSLTYASLQSLGVVAVASMAAYEFAFFEFSGKKFLFGLALSSMMIPYAVTLIPAFRVLVSIKWLNTFQGLAIPGMASAQAIFIIKQFMESLPTDLLSAADIDGASHFGKFYHIVLPNCTNALLTAGLLAFINAWGNFIWPLITITKQEMYPVSLIINAYTAASAYKTQDEVLGALFLAAIVPIVIYIFFQKYIVKGIATSGIKG